MERDPSPLVGDSPQFVTVRGQDNNQSCYKEAMRRRDRGLTLVELMVTMAAAIILLAVGMPLFTGVVANNRAAAQANALVTALNLARSEAVGRGTTVSLRHADTDADSDADTTADWEDGWQVFVDEDADGQVDVGADEVLRVWPPLSTKAALTLSDGDAVTFGFNGASTGAQVEFELGEIEGEEDATGLVRRCVTVTGSGQIRTKRESGGETWSCP
jgi:type IV fimbrial biogenesis protein FimT